MNDDLQRTEKWIEERRGKATASNFEKIMGRNKRTGKPLAAYYDYMNQLVQEIITGKVADRPDNPYMEWGRKHEKTALMEYRLQTGYIVLPSGFTTHPAHMGIGASPDGELQDLNGGVEFKCPSTKTHLATLEAYNIPQKNYAQVQGQMWVKGWDFIDFVSYDPRVKKRLFIIRIYRDDEYIKRLGHEVFEFMQQVYEKVDLLQGGK